LESAFHVNMTKQSEILFLVGTYTIGKERVFRAIAEALDCKIYAPYRKTKLLLMQENPELTDRLTDDPWKTCLHVVRMGDLGLDTLKKYLEVYTPRYKCVVAFRPTGWTFKGGSTGNQPDHDQENEDVLRNVTLTGANEDYSICIFGVPYSEHSSFSELEAFVRGIQVRKVIPTVNVGQERSRKEMDVHFQQWLQRSA
jgi:DNA cross-link repair 1A protein